MNLKLERRSRVAQADECFAARCWRGLFEKNLRLRERSVQSSFWDQTANPEGDAESRSGHELLDVTGVHARLAADAAHGMAALPVRTRLLFQSWRSSGIKETSRNRGFEETDRRPYTTRNDEKMMRHSRL